MKEVLCISANTLLLIIAVSSLGGTFAGGFLVRTYVKQRGLKTKAQKELQRLSRWVEKHYDLSDDDVADLSIVDVAIKLISHKPVQKSGSDT